MACPELILCTEQSQWRSQGGVAASLSTAALLMLDSVNSSGKETQILRAVSKETPKAPQQRASSLEFLFVDMRSRYTRRRKNTVAERVNTRKSSHKVMVLNGDAFFLLLRVVGLRFPFLFKTMIPCMRIVTNLDYHLLRSS